MSDRIEAVAPFPANVQAFTTLRQGAGASSAPFDSFNLGNFRGPEGDDPAVVARNRVELVERFALPAVPHWLRQVHGTEVVRFDAEDRAGDEPEADAAVTSAPGVVLAILTADCLPVLFAAKDGSEIAAAHAGWGGLANGVLEAALAAMRAPPAQVVAWIGPCAGPARYEVGRNVFDAFVAHYAGAAAAFAPTREGHWLADLPALARLRLVASGMATADIHGGDLCTISDPVRFFSHRRDGRSGRLATIVWRS
ncbi:MAG TPA: peptidoglycan editing factor PgeF [Luteimonas sp.]|nr:peptidoglycan editing factor PgeF [Luteimonas sp.]